MIRHCDGFDTNLVRKVTTGPDAHGVMHERYETCNCGATFDDVDHKVIFPHERF